MDTRLAATLRRSRLVALAIAALPSAAAAVATMLDQSMRRPSLGRVVLQSVQMAF